MIGWLIEWDSTYVLYPSFMYIYIYIYVIAKYFIIYIIGVIFKYLTSSTAWAPTNQGGHPPHRARSGPEAPTGPWGGQGHVPGKDQNGQGEGELEKHSSSPTLQKRLCKDAGGCSPARGVS